jgi:hypothetical protein
MLIVANQGANILCEVEGEGPTLVLQHGFTDSLPAWFERGLPHVTQFMSDKALQATKFRRQVQALLLRSLSGRAIDQRA